MDCMVFQGGEGGRGEGLEGREWEMGKIVAKAVFLLASFRVQFSLHSEFILIA